MIDEKKYSAKNLIRLQSLTWYVVFALFVTVAILYLIGWPQTDHLAKAGVIVILVATLLKLIVIGEKFRKIKQKRLMILSYILLLILLSTAMVKYIL